MLPGFFHDTLGRARTARSRSSKARAFILERFAEPLDAAVAARCRPHAATPATRPTRSRRRCRRCRRAGSTGPLTRLNMRLGGLAVGRHRARPPHRLRFRLDARLRLSQRAARTRAARPRRSTATISTRSAGAASASASSHVEELLRDAMARLRGKGMPVRVHGHRRRPRPLRARGARRPRRSGRTRSCCATTATSTSRPARALIAEKGLAGIARFVKGDAFDRDSLAASSRSRRSASSPASTSCSPTTRMVRRSLAGLAGGDPGRAAISSTPASPGIRSSS